MYGTQVNAPKGLVPSAYSGNSTYNHQATSLTVTPGYGTALFQGDPLIMLNGGGVGRYSPAASTIGIIGVVKGFQYTLNGFYTEKNYLAAGIVPDNSGQINCETFTDPNILWDIQSASNAGGPVNPTTTALLGANTVVNQPTFNQNYLIDVAVTSYTALANGTVPASNPATGNTITGASNFYLAANTHNTTATLPVKLLYLTPAPGNVGGVPFNNGICIINNHVLKGGTGTDGI